VITSTSNSFSVVWVTNLIPVFSNAPWDPAGFFHLEFIPVRTLVAQTVFNHTFANLVTFQIVNGNFVAVPVW
jgi:hypothetical protein